MGKNELLDDDLLEIRNVGQKRKRWTVFKPGWWRYGTDKAVEFKRICEVQVTEELKNISSDGVPKWDMIAVHLDTARSRPNVLVRALRRVRGWFVKPQPIVPKAEVVGDTKVGG